MPVFSWAWKRESTSALARASDSKGLSSLCACVFFFFFGGVGREAGEGVREVVEGVVFCFPPAKGARAFGRCQRSIKAIDRLPLFSRPGRARRAPRLSLPSCHAREVRTLYLYMAGDRDKAPQSGKGSKKIKDERGECKQPFFSIERNDLRRRLFASLERAKRARSPCTDAGRSTSLPIRKRQSRARLDEQRTQSPSHSPKCFFFD